MPVPNPPGTAAFPPSATGNRASTMRCPVTSGSPCGEPPRDGPRHAHRPLVHEREGACRAVRRAKRADGRVFAHVAATDDRDDDAGGVRRREARLRARAVALRVAEDRAAADRLAFAHARREGERAGRRVPHPGCDERRFSRRTAAAADRRRCVRGGPGRAGSRAATRCRRPRCRGGSRTYPRTPGRRSRRRRGARPRPTAPPARRALPRATRTAFPRRRGGRVRSPSGCARGSFGIAQEVEQLRADVRAIGEKALLRSVDDVVIRGDPEPASARADPRRTRLLIP